MTPMSIIALYDDFIFGLIHQAGRQHRVSSPFVLNQKAGKIGTLRSGDILGADLTNEAIRVVLETL